LLSSKSIDDLDKVRLKNGRAESLGKRNLRACLIKGILDRCLGIVSANLSLDVAQNGGAEFALNIKLSFTLHRRRSWLAELNLGADDSWVFLGNESLNDLHDIRLKNSAAKILGEGNLLASLVKGSLDSSFSLVRANDLLDIGDDNSAKLALSIDYIISLDRQLQVGVNMVLHLRLDLLLSDLRVVAELDLLADHGGVQLCDDLRKNCGDLGLEVSHTPVLDVKASAKLINGIHEDRSVLALGRLGLKRSHNVHAHNALQTGESLNGGFLLRDSERKSAENCKKSSEKSKLHEILS
jgi:hypothetical protein